MKKLIVIAAVLMSSISFGSVNPGLKNEIVNRVNPDLSEIELDAFHQDFVVVSFCIKDGKITIIDIQGSQEELIQLITLELMEINIQREYSDTDIHNYKFNFNKA